MRWLDSIIDSTDMNLSKLWEIEKDRRVWRAIVHGVTESWTQLRDWSVTQGTLLNTLQWPMAKESKKRVYIHICITDSLCCTPESITLCINYTPIKINKYWWDLCLAILTIHPPSAHSPPSSPTSLGPRPLFIPVQANMVLARVPRWLLPYSEL